MVISVQICLKVLKKIEPKNPEQQKDYDLIQKLEKQFSELDKQIEVREDAGKDCYNLIEKQGEVQDKIESLFKKNKWDYNTMMSAHAVTQPMTPEQKARKQKFLNRLGEQQKHIQDRIKDTMDKIKKFRGIKGKEGTLASHQIDLNQLHNSLKTVQDKIKLHSQMSEHGYDTAEYKISFIRDYLKSKPESADMFEKILKDSQTDKDIKKHFDIWLGNGGTVILRDELADKYFSDYKNELEWRNVWYVIDSAMANLKAKYSSHAVTKPFIGTVGKKNYAIMINSLPDGNDFVTQNFGQQINSMKVVKDWKESAKKDYVGSKGKPTLSSVKNWIKENKPTEFYASWGSDSVHTKMIL